MPRSGRPSRHYCTNRVGRSSDFRVRPARPSHRPQRNKRRGATMVFQRIGPTSKKARLQRRGRPGLSPEFPVRRPGKESTSQPPTHNAQFCNNARAGCKERTADFRIFPHFLAVANILLMTASPQSDSLPSQWLSEHRPRPPTAGGSVARVNCRTIRRFSGKIRSRAANTFLNERRVVE